MRKLLILAVAACGGDASQHPTLNSENVVATQIATPVAPEDVPTTRDPWASRTDLIQAPPAAAPAPVPLPDVKRFTLPNGLRVIVVERHGLPLVTMHLAVGAGGEDEPVTKRSIADYAAAMLTHGTTKHSAVELAATMDFVGGQLQASADLESTHVVCESLVHDFATCLTLLPEVALQPSFPEDEMRIVGSQLTAALKEQRDDPRALAGVHLLNLVWGDNHARGWPRTPEAIAAIKRADLVAWHKARFVPGNAVLAVAGDVDAAKLKTELGRAFQTWRGGTAPAAPKYADPVLKGQRIRLIDKPDAPQSQIALGELGVAQKDKDYLAMVLVNYVLGGGDFSSRLLNAVRVQRGKSYGAESELERWRSRGMLVASTFTRTPETVGTLRIVLGELAKMQQSGPTAEELAAAKAAIAGRYPAGFETAADAASIVLAADLHGLPDSWVSNFPVAIAQVGLDEVKAAAKAHVDAENVDVVIVGNGDLVAKQLDAANLKYERVGWQEPVSAKDRKARPAGSSDADKTRDGKALIEAALTAHGGAEKLQALKSVRSVGKIHLKVGGQAVDGDWVRLLVPPERLRLEIGIPSIGQSLIMTTTPDAVWQTAGSEVRLMPTELAAQARAGLWREHELILLHARETGTVVQAAGKETVGKESYDVVLMRRSAGDEETKVYLDPKTHRIARLAFQQGGAPAYEEYGDYKQVEGVWLPFRRRAEGGPQSYDVTISAIQINTAYDAALFAKPAAPTK